MHLKVVKIKIIMLVFTNFLYFCINKFYDKIVKEIDTLKLTTIALSSIRTTILSLKFVECRSGIKLDEKNYENIRNII
jgi:hypothetical protein